VGGSCTVALNRERFSFDDGKITGNFLPALNTRIEVPALLNVRLAVQQTERSSAWEDFRAELPVKLCNRKIQNNKRRTGS
jgi:hypothetical protein